MDCCLTTTYPGKVGVRVDAVQVVGEAEQVVGREAGVRYARGVRLPVGNEERHLQRLVRWDDQVVRAAPCWPDDVRWLYQVVKWVLTLRRHVPGSSQSPKLSIGTSNNNYTKIYTLS